MTTPTDPDLIRAEIEQTRADLGETAAALVAKADVKQRVKDTAAHAGDQVKEQARHVAEHTQEAMETAREHLSEGADAVTDAARIPRIRNTVIAVVALLAVIGVVVRWRRR